MGIPPFPVPIGHIRIDPVGSGEGRAAKVYTIEQVEDLNAKLRGNAFGDWRVLQDGEVYVAEAGTKELISSIVPNWFELIVKELGLIHCTGW